ncbi:MAG: tetratricopeptide repeat protein [Planctomycetaceae bacterium]|nr:tetratricopeptide repeat protein [Planctomycetaceae bacterium]
MTEAASDPLVLGQARMTAGDYAQALSLFDEALRADPSRFLAVFERARCYQALGRWDEAIHGFTEALRLDGTEPASYVNRATCRGSLADHAGAAEDLERFLDARPERGDVWIDLGDRRLDAGLYGRAADAYEKAVALQPGKAADLAPWIERGRRLDAAQSSGAKSDVAAACRERGWAKLDAGGFRTSAAWFNRAIDAVPEDGAAWHGRGVARSRLGQAAEARADLEKAVKLAPDLADAWTELGRVRSIQGDAAGALAAAEEALRRKPDGADAAFVRGVARGKLGEFAGAEADFTRCLEALPKDALSWLNRGWVRRKAGRPKEAIADLDRSLELDPKHPLAFYHRGFARRDLGDLRGADADFRSAMALDATMVDELTPLLQPTASAAPPRPAPVSAAPVEWTAKEVLVMTAILLAVLALGVVRIPYLGGISARALDFPYKAGWIVGHWTDPIAFPHECNLCMEPFCTRVDVAKKHVCGRPGYTSDTRWRYCPAHEAGLICTDTRLDAFVMIPYMGLSLLLGAVAIGFGALYLVRILLLPVTAVLALRGRIPKGAVLPLLAAEDTWLYRVDMAAVTASLVLSLAILLMYIIW